MSNREITAVINTYEELENFERCVKSVKDSVDRIVVADGAYSDFPHESATSSSKIRRIYRKHSDFFISCSEDEPWIDEAHKRNALLGAVPLNTWVLRIDSDEILRKFTPEALKEGHDVYLGKMSNFEAENTVRNTRYNTVLFKKRPETHYKERDSLYYGEKSATKKNYRKTTEIMIEHHPYDRPQSRLKRRKEYRERVGQHYESFK